MDKANIDDKYIKIQEKLKIDCKNCSGLCCVALYCMKSDGFPANKEAGVPCMHLASDFSCEIHSKLREKNMRGCLAYDCFGAGQRTTKNCYFDTNWKTDPNKAKEIYQVFLTVFQLHQTEWYLIQSLHLTDDEGLKTNICELIDEGEQMASMDPQNIIAVDLEEYRARVGKILKRTAAGIKNYHPDNSKTKLFLGKNFKKANLEGRDFSMSLMIAANLEGCNLRHTNFLGADMRDANIKNTDLRESLFLTQMQINSAKGNANTRLPEYLSYPDSWLKTNK